MKHLKKVAIEREYQEAYTCDVCHERFEDDVKSEVLFDNQYFAYGDTLGRKESMDCCEDCWDDKVKPLLQDTFKTVFQTEGCSRFIDD